MPTTTVHRKTVRHYNNPSTDHELTFSCYRRMPLLTDEPARRELGIAVQRAVLRLGYGVVAFVFMPEHVHLLVRPTPGQAYDIAALLYAIKRPSSFRIKQWMQRHANPRLAELTIRDRPGHASFRFWQEGPGYDRNITEPDTLQNAINYIHHNPVKRGLCDFPWEWAWSSWTQWHRPETTLLNEMPRIARRVGA